MAHNGEASDSIAGMHPAACCPLPTRTPPHFLPTASPLTAPNSALPKLLGLAPPIWEQLFIKCSLSAASRPRLSLRGSNEEEGSSPC
ncbi:hypothetical protein NQZ68_013249 [Dissostichus eleginoides]|nr:hypothetical protein NQZ68_013249 [Dissostichus eleginoides]